MNQSEINNLVAITKQEIPILYSKLDRINYLKEIRPLQKLS